MTLDAFNQFPEEVYFAYTYRAGTYVARRWNKDKKQLIAVELVVDSFM